MPSLNFTINETYIGETYIGETYIGETDIVETGVVIQKFPIILLIIIVPLCCIVLCACIINCQDFCYKIKTRNYYSDNNSLSSWGSNYSSPGTYSSELSYNFDKDVEIDFNKRFIIKDMEKFILNKINIQKTHDDICAICINDYILEDEIIKFNCSHDYHLKCITPWLKENILKGQAPSCPLCKEVLIIEETEFGIEL